MNKIELELAIKNGEIKEHHTSLFRGYVSTIDGESQPREYNGPLGKGFTKFSPKLDSSYYSYITYYLHV